MSFFSKLFNRKEQENIQDNDTDYEGVEEQEKKPKEEENSDIEMEASDSEEGDIEYEVVEREILPTKIICPDCGGITLEGLDFCDKCGGELN